MAITQRLLPGVGLVELDDSSERQALLPGAGMLDTGEGEGGGGGGPGGSAALTYVINT